MNKSESIAALAKALAEAQGELENASKSTKNKFFDSKYADLAEVLNTVRPVLSKHKLSVAQFPSFADGVASVESILMHESGEFISSVASAPVSKQDAQGVGSATTYLRRYSLAAIAGIAQEDDDANSSVGHAPKRTEEGKPVIDELQYKALCDKNEASIIAIKMGIANNDLSTAAEAWRELDEETKMALWKAPTKGGCFTVKEREVMKSTEFREA
jgi:hypothetical protein